MATELAIHRLSTADYKRMVKAGVLEGKKVEFLDGYLVDALPQGPEHNRAIRLLTRHLSGRGDLLAVQLPLNVEEGWVPEPDVALADLPNEDHPGTALLVVEVAVTAHYEARIKAPAYARARIPRYWIVDVPGRKVLEHTDPGRDGYATVTEKHPGDQLDPGVEGIVPIPVAEILP